MKETDKIASLATYNLWANKRLITWLKQHDEAVLTTTCNSSFANIKDTLNHLLDAQIFYYCILNEQPFEREWGHSIDEVFKGTINQSEDFVNYLKDQDTLNEVRWVKTKRLNGKFYQFELIQHCMNHSTYHRGQIITIAHQLGLAKAPSTDLLYYFIERNKKQGDA